MFPKSGLAAPDVDPEDAGRQFRVIAQPLGEDPVPVFTPPQRRQWIGNRNLFWIAPAGWVDNKTIIGGQHRYLGAIWRNGCVPYHRLRTDGNGFRALDILRVKTQSLARPIRQSEQTRS